MRTSLFSRWMAAFVLLPCVALSVNAQKETKEEKWAEAALKTKLEAELAQMYPKATYKSSIDRYGTKVTISQPGTVFYVVPNNFLAGGPYVPAQKVDTSSDNGSLNAIGGILNLISAPYAAQSASCDKFVFYTYPEVARSPVPPECEKDIEAGNAQHVATGQKVLVAKIAVFPKAGQVQFTLLDYNPNPDGTIGEPKFLSHAGIVFPPEYLATATPEELKKAIRHIIVTADEYADVAKSAKLGEELKTILIPATFTGSVQKLGNNVTLTKPGAILDVAKGGVIPEFAYVQDTSKPAVAAPVSAKSKGSAPAPSPSVAYVAAAPGCSKGTKVSIADGSVTNLDTQCGSELSAGKAHFAAAGQRLMVLQTGADIDNDLVMLNLVDYNPNGDGTVGPAHFVAGVEFQFAKGALTNMSAVQVTDAISTVLAPDMGPAMPAAAMTASATPADARMPKTLDGQLETIFKLTSLLPDGSANTLGSTVKLIHGNGIVVTPLRSTAAVCAAMFQNEKLQASHCGAARAGAARQGAMPSGAKAAAASKSFRDGQPVDITAIKVDTKKETVRFELVDDTRDPASGQRKRSSTKGAVDFVFPAGFLEAADAGQVADAVSQELLSSDAAVLSDAALPPSAAAPPPAAAAAPSGGDAQPASIQMGMTVQQVQTMMGAPKQTVDLGVKKILVYPSLKITFVNGKVSDVQ